MPIQSSMPWRYHALEAEAKPDFPVCRRLFDFLRHSKRA
ncbi:hypothetical protein Agau_C101604 [Agrobacterium tumefaciens F2]|nr:hypothetical protein Agau_C101604 [Agrobacterium tumefaciens F2]